MTANVRIPHLAAEGVTLRPLRAEDAEALFESLMTGEATRFVSPPPPTVDGFRRYIEWAALEADAGRHVGIAVEPAGSTSAVGIFQVRQLGTASGTAEWGFVIGSRHWGSGLFMRAAPLLVDFVLGHLGVRRLEARAVVCNGRGNGALAKIGAVHEAVLQQSLYRHERPYDEHLWTISAHDWAARRSGRLRRPH